MDNIIQFTLLVLAVFTVSALGTRTVIALTQRNNIVQKVNHRSMHKIPTPVGGGWSVILSSTIVWLLILGVINEKHAVLLVSIFSLAVMSWLDDVKTLPARSRFGMQLLAVAGCLYYIPSDVHILHSDIPFILDRLISGFCWLWFINLFNFMDGMDGLAGSETICVSLGIVLVGSAIGLSQAYISLSLLLAAAMAGFLLWNWPPARVFLGDVGSVPVGFLLGWLLIQLAIQGGLLAAFILPLYFLFDASLTLTCRLLKGEKIWEAHRQHLYQRAALSGLSHAQVVLRILPSNLMLMLSAYISVSQPMLGILLALLSLVLIMVALFALKPGDQETD